MLLWRERLLEEGPGEEQVERKLAEPRLGREKTEVERLLLHWLLRCSAHHSLSSASAHDPLRGLCCSLGWDPARWWWRRFLWWEAFRAMVGGAELGPVTAGEAWAGSLWRLKCGA